MDFARLREFLDGYDDIVLTEESNNLCSDESLVDFKRLIEENKLNRVLLGMCTPNKHLDEFRDAAQDIGLNRYLVDSVNIREQIAFIHQNEPEEMQVKLMDQFAMAIAKLRATQPADKVYAVVDDHRCNGCHICYTVCDKDAIRMVPDKNGRVTEVSLVDKEKCWGCGVCVTSCPVDAIDMTVYSNREMIAQVDTFIERMRPDGINALVLSCHWCAYPAADAAGAKRLPIDPHFRSIRTLCSGRVDPDWILKALTRGADGVLLLGGKPHACHFESGNMRTMSRMKLIKLLMSQLGLHDNRFHVEWMDPEDPERYAQVVDDFVKELRKLGPNPLSSVDKDYSSAKRI
ncbi:MAG: hydrogenase iron-sulfur subunit [Candidatus Methanomethylophilaceae archaeon]